ncbi:hypothetical protein ACHAWF_010748 [Thalassiosira exigua]
MKRLLPPGSSPLAAALIVAASTPWWCPSPAFSTPAPPPPSSAYLRDHPGLVVPPGPHHGRAVVRLLGRGRGEGDDEEDPRRGPPPARRVRQCGVLRASDLDRRRNGREELLQNFVGLDLARLRIDPRGHQELGVRFGPNLAIPDGISDDVLKFFLRRLPGGGPENDGNLRPAATAWLN